MKTLAPIMLLCITLFMTAAPAAESTPPYIEINVQGIEEVAPPLNRLADAIEKLSDSDKLSAEDQHKIVAVIGELRTLSGDLDNTISTTKTKISQAQTEISDSLRQLIFISLLSLTLAIVVICAAVFYLFKLQFAPLIQSGATTADKMAGAIDNLSSTAEFIAQQGESQKRRFARKQRLVR